MTKANLKRIEVRVHYIIEELDSGLLTLKQVRAHRKLLRHFTQVLNHALSQKE